ncbi:MAG: fumarylacetoacetate hydrolase family protein [Halodesulfurarchaeum sp.]
MRYFRTRVDGSTHLVVDADDDWYDLTAAKSRVTGFRDLLTVSDVAGTDPDDLARRLIDRAAQIDAPTEDGLARPLVPDEVWGAGVTYQISEEAREAESGMAEVYLQVYEADRPEIFFKATPNRIVGPGDAIGIRADSDWNVPEPELGIVLFDGDVVGFTLGNDVSSRDIEGTNPLYLPQAKIYENSCSIGPSVRSADSVADPHDLRLAMRIERDGDVLYEEETDTGEMVREVEELVSYYTRHNHVPELAVLLTGTSLVPPDDFTLETTDTVEMDLESVGTLRNDVIEV